MLSLNERRWGLFKIAVFAAFNLDMAVLAAEAAQTMEMLRDACTFLQNVWGNRSRDVAEVYAVASCLLQTAATSYATIDAASGDFQQPLQFPESRRFFLYDPATQHMPTAWKLRAFWNSVHLHGSIPSFPANQRPG